MLDVQDVTLVLTAVTAAAAVAAAFYYRQQTAIFERQEERSIAERTLAAQRAEADAARASRAEERAERAEQRVVAAEARALAAEVRARASEERAIREADAEEAMWQLVEQVRSDIEAAREVELPECEIEDGYIRLAERAIERGYLKRGSGGPRFVASSDQASQRRLLPGHLSLGPLHPLHPG